MKRKPTGKAIGDNVSFTQRVAQPDKVKIITCREVKFDEMYDIKNLPQHIMDAIIDDCLFQKWYDLPKFRFSIPDGRNEIEFIINLVLRL